MRRAGIRPRRTPSFPHSSRKGRFPQAILTMNFFTSLLIPALLSLFGLACCFSRRDLPDAYLKGAQEGLQSAFRLLPSLALLMTAVSMFTASGAAEALASLLRPLLSRLGIPSELVPLLIVRPVSGSGSTALLSELYERLGADSFAARCASILAASSDTLLYITAVYMSAADVRKTRHTLPAALLVMLLGVFLSCLAARLLFA